MRAGGIGQLLVLSTDLKLLPVALSLNYSCSSQPDFSNPAWGAIVGALLNCIFAGLVSAWLKSRMDTKLVLQTELLKSELLTALESKKIDLQKGLEQFKATLQVQGARAEQIREERRLWLNEVARALRVSVAAVKRWPRFSTGQWLAESANVRSSAINELREMLRGSPTGPSDFELNFQIDGFEPSDQAAHLRALLIGQVEASAARCRRLAEQREALVLRCDVDFANKVRETLETIHHQLSGRVTTAPDTVQRVLRQLDDLDNALQVIIAEI